MCSVVWNPSTSAIDISDRHVINRRLLKLKPTDFETGQNRMMMMFSTSCSQCRFHSVGKDDDTVMITTGHWGLGQERVITVKSNLEDLPH